MHGTNISFKSEDEWHGVLSAKDAWLYSCVTGGILMITSLSGHVFSRLINSKYYVMYTNFMTSFGMSCMMAVIFFQLIEPSYYDYKMGPPEKKDCSGDVELTGDEWIIVAIISFVAFPLFFNVDKIMTLILSGKSTDEETVGTEIGTPINKHLDLTGRIRSTTHVSMLSTVRRITLSGSQAVAVRGGAVSQIHAEPELTGRDRAISDLITIQNIIAKAEKKEEVFVANGPVRLAVDSTAYMAIIGSLIESIVYGLTIGSAWHRNIGFGVSIGIALVTEAIPHKISDYLLLIDTGMTKRVAGLTNFCTTSFMLVGITLSTTFFEGVYDNNWVFGLSVGIFAYAALGVLLPELDQSIQNSVKQGYNKWVCLLLQNLGIIAAFFIMFPIAVSGHCWSIE